jgi:hypothetical protein
MVEACLAKTNMIEDTSNPAWYLDSGTSNHITGDKSVFSSLQNSQGQKVRSAGGHGHDVTGVGNVAIQLPSGEIQSINHVLYSPSICKNLLSIGFLTDKKMSLDFHDSECLIRNQHGTIIARAVREAGSRLYRLVGQTIHYCTEILVCNVISHDNTVTLWHKRLGHFHHQGMRRMMQTGAVKGLPNVRIGNFSCSSCIQGKQSRSKVPKNRTSVTSRPLELVHMDVCGPLRVKSLGGAVYFLTFIDDFSKKTWIYFLSHKNECLEKSKPFTGK